MNKTTTKERNYSLDILRIVACFLVVLYHSRAANRDHLITSDPISVINNACSFLAFVLGRLGVPFFLLLGGYFAFATQINTFSFLRKRLTRISIPAAFWLLVSTMLIGGTLNFFHNIWNLTCAGHLWYIYTLIGILFIIPIVNPYIQRATSKEISLYLGIWVLTLIFNGNYIDMLGTYSLTHSGMCASNIQMAFISFYGFFGYYILGFLLRRYTLSNCKILLLVVLSMIAWAVSTFTLGCNITGLYGSWFYLSIPVVLMSSALFSCFSKVNICKMGGGNFENKLFDIWNLLGTLANSRLSIRHSIFQAC